MNDNPNSKNHSISFESDPTKRYKISSISAAVLNGHVYIRVWNFPISNPNDKYSPADQQLRTPITFDLTDKKCYGCIWGKSVQDAFKEIVDLELQNPMKYEPTPFPSIAELRAEENSDLRNWCKKYTQIETNPISISGQINKWGRMEFAPGPTPPFPTTQGSTLAK